MGRLLAPLPPTASLWAGSGCWRDPRGRPQAGLPQDKAGERENFRLPILLSSRGEITAIASRNPLFLTRMVSNTFLALIIEGEGFED